MPLESVELTDDPLWYQDALIYELHVRAFADSDGDGIGDFRGLTEKLDYLQDLGVTAIWLLPFYPSPLRDDGYDIADYTSIHTDYGNLRHFRRFLREAHARGLRVITELVINHTSDQHPWFRRAVREGPGTRYGDWYVWSDTADRYSEARIIFQDFESSNWSWHPRAGAYYWHRFYSHQPDLNFDNAEVREALLRVLDFWLGMGVDGMRLDAIPYLFQREGTNCENLPETHAYLKTLRAHLDRSHPNRMFLAEANQWPEDAAAYFGDGDECHMNFHFPLMPRLFMAVRMEDRFPVIDILQQTPDIAPSCQWAVFLRNHDELTLEMVTDEERDYMYRAYANDPRMRLNLGIRRRLGPLLGNNRRLVELLNGLLFSMPGTPVLYYGDEIGMGDNIYLGDRNGVRTPMQWSADRNAGFSRANPQRLYLPIIIDPEYHYETVNVEAQQNNPSSLLWWMKRLIALRKRYRVFGRGSIEFLYPENPKVLAFVREHEDERVLVVANLSRFVQHAELELDAHRGLVPVELFGHTRFPPVSDRPYPLTLGPHAFYWFALEPQRAEASLSMPARDPELVVAPTAEPPQLAVSWADLLGGQGRRALQNGLPDVLRTRRWFGGKARPIRSATVREWAAVPRGGDEGDVQVAIVHVEYVEGEAEDYLLPLAFATGERAERILVEHPHEVVAHLRPSSPGKEGVVYDALHDPGFGRTLLATIARRRRLKATNGELVGQPARAFRRLRADGDLPDPSVLRAEQSNTSIVYGDRFILKVVRKLEAGTNPDLEIGRFLTERVGFPHVPPLAGAIEYERERHPSRTVAILQGFVHNEGDAWSYTLDELGRFYERVQAEPPQVALESALPGDDLLDLVDGELPEVAFEVVGSYLPSAELLGQRTAQLHLALASDADEPAFAPEPFTALYQRSLYQSVRTLARRNFALLRRGIASLPESHRDLAEGLIAREAELIEGARAVTGHRFDGHRIRIHGDYHLGQVLYTGRDFVILDFEGEPARPLGERRLKRSPLRDVAGMLRSFHYGTYAALFDLVDRGAVAPGSDAYHELENWARPWRTWVSVAFLGAYLEEVADGELLPRARDDIRTLLSVLLLEKALYELGYELNNRPTWVPIPLEGLLHLTGAGT